MSKSHVINSIRQGVLRASFIVAMYAAIGFWVLPPLACHALNAWMQAHLRIPATLERVEFDPFTGELTLHQLRIAEGERAWLAFSRLSLDVEIDSLWKRVLQIRYLQLDDADVSLERAKTGTLNLLSLRVLPEAGGIRFVPPRRTPSFRSGFNSCPFVMARYAGMISCRRGQSILSYVP